MAFGVSSPFCMPARPHCEVLSQPPLIHLLPLLPDKAPSLGNISVRRSQGTYKNLWVPLHKHAWVKRALSCPEQRSSDHHQTWVASPFCPLRMTVFWHHWWLPLQVVPTSSESLSSLAKCHLKPGRRAQNPHKQGQWQSRKIAISWEGVECSWEMMEGCSLKTLATSKNHYTLGLHCETHSWILLALVLISTPGWGFWTQDCMQYLTWGIMSSQRPRWAFPKVAHLPLEQTLALKRVLVPAWGAVESYWRGGTNYAGTSQVCRSHGSAIEFLKQNQFGGKACWPGPVGRPWKPSQWMAAVGSWRNGEEKAT